MKEDWNQFSGDVRELESKIITSQSEITNLKDLSYHLAEGLKELDTSQKSNHQFLSDKMDGNSLNLNQLAHSLSSQSTKLGDMELKQLVVIYFCLLLFCILSHFAIFYLFLSIIITVGGAVRAEGGWIDG